MSPTPAAPIERTRVSELARFARRWAPWRVVIAALAAIAAIHVLWALGVWWPASTSDALADAVVGRRPFPPAPLNAGVAAALFGAVVVVAGSMRSDLPPSVSRLCCLGASAVVVVLGMRGVLGLVGSITGLEGSTDRYRVLDIALYSPLCLWAAFGIYYRWPTRPG